MFLACLDIVEGIGEEYARLRIRAQKSSDWFQTQCTYTLENNGGKAEFEAACRELFSTITKND